METDFARSISVASVCRSRCAPPVPDRPGRERGPMIWRIAAGDRRRSQQT
jgi:hypothetical protein